jgi:hypothetical protein
MTNPAGSTSARALGGALAGVFEAPARIAAALAGTLTRGSSSCGRETRSSSLCGCEIPPPCWEPQTAGTCCLELTPGSSATVRVHVSNCGWSRQVVAITALGKLAGWMTFSPTALFLDPMERATILVTVHVPDKVPLGHRFSAPIIVRGCRDHFVRVGITVSDCAGRNCCDVMVDDCADNMHHWYDHFYCPRPCRNVRDPTGAGVRNG